MTLVKSLYSGDPDVIDVDVIGLHDRWCYSGKSHKFRTTAIILNLLHMSLQVSPCVTPHALGQPCRGSE